MGNIQIPSVSVVWILPSRGEEITITRIYSDSQSSDQETEHNLYPQRVWLIFFIGILEFKQTLLPPLYLGGFPAVEWDSHYVRNGRDLKDDHSEPAQNANEEEMWRRRRNVLRIHRYSRAEAVKGIVTHCGPHLFPLHHIQLLAFS